MNKALLLWLPIISLAGCSIRTAPPQKAVQSPIVDQQQVIKNKIAELTTTNSSPWVYVGKSVAGENYYLNVETVKKLNTDELVLIEGSNQVSSSQPTQAWWKLVSSDNTYYQIQSNFYCYMNATKQVTAVQYSASDQYMGSPTTKSRYSNNIIPNTVFADIYELVCSLK